MAQVESNEYKGVREHKKEVVELTKANNKMAAKLAQMEDIYFDQKKQHSTACDGCGECCCDC